MKKEFVVIIGDLIGSTEVDRRGILQKKLVVAYQKVNRTFKEDVYAPIKITRGDEIAGVIIHPANLYRMATQIGEGIYPHRMRFIFVKGRLTAGVETKDAAIIDGPAFKKAGEYISLAKRVKADFVFDLGNPAEDESLNSLANLVAEIKHGWTENQRKVAELYTELRNQEKVARRMRVSQQNVAKALKSIAWKKIYQAEETVNKILAKYADTT